VKKEKFAILADNTDKPAGKKHQSQLMWDVDDPEQIKTDGCAPGTQDQMRQVA